MGVDALIWIGLGIAFVAFLLSNILSVIYFIGIFFGAISSIFDIFQYIGASCSLISSVKTAFFSAGIFFICMIFYKKFLAQSV